MTKADFDIICANMLLSINNEGVNKKWLNMIIKALFYTVVMN